MKTAHDYAQQALRIAERVTDDVDALRADWQSAMKDGRRMARKKGVRHAVGAAASARADADGKRQCAPVLQTIAARAGVTRRTVQYTMRKLERARLVRVDGYGRDGEANTYTLFPLEV